VLGDTPKPPRKPKAQAGHLTLGLGGDAGTTIAGETRAGDTQPLAQALALAQVRSKRDPQPARVATLEDDAKRASDAMLKVQEILEHLTDIAEGHVDAATLGGWAEDLIDRLKYLDPDGHWQERLRVVRTLVVLLALLERWLELAQALSDALQAAERLGDDGTRAWVDHELGTLHLAAGQHVEADDHLSEALQLRTLAKYEAGMKATEANLRVLCKMLRAQLHQTPAAGEQPRLEAANGGPTGRLLRRPLLLVVLGLAFLTVGGVAGAAISGEPGVNIHRLAVVIESVPATPQAGEPVTFRTVVKNRADPDHYSWLFGDGEGTASASPTHVYLRPGSYTVTVALSGPRGSAAGEATRTVIVRPQPSRPEPGPPAASFSVAPSPARAGQTVHFNANDSSDPDPQAMITDYLWNFGDGRTQTGISPTHIYAKPGIYTVELLVADTRGDSNRTTHTIVVETQATNIAGKPVKIAVASPGKPVKPAFTSATSATFAAGASERFPVTATGKPTPTITESGTLPSGVSFAGSALAGTPATTGTFPLTFTATNGAGSATQFFTLTVAATSIRPQITSPPSANFKQATEGSFTVTAIGTPTPTITESGTLPSGVSFNAGTLTGTPTTTGSFPLTFTATNSAGSSTQSFTLTVGPQTLLIKPDTKPAQPPPESKPTFTSAESTTFEYGREERFPITAVGEPTPTITSEGKLPEGIKFDDGALVGATRQIGNFPLTFTASNKAGSTVQTFVLKTVECREC
jgi:PKD repeat protein